MFKKIYLHLLILCGILCQGTMASLLHKDTSESSSYLVRKKRVISHLPNGLTPIRINQAKYVVTIRENNRSTCVGVILSHYTVITSASCVKLHIVRYYILSGSAYPERSFYHNVTSKDTYYGNPPHQEYDGIALITVDPLFVFSAKTGSIPLYVGPIHAGTEVTVYGWGCAYTEQSLPPGTRRMLRSITLPILQHEECQNIYRNNYHNANMRSSFTITNKHVCTYDRHQYCARTDAGAPLVVNNELAGIHVWKGEFRHKINPDVYINLQNADYREWVRNHTLLM